MRPRGAFPRVLSRGLATAALLAGGALAWGWAARDEAESCLADDEIGRFVRVEGGGFVQGADGVYPEEARPARVFVSPFLLQTHEVTNGQFEQFVAETGYVTEAERGGGSAQFVETTRPADPMSWWELDASASWRTPDGAGSDLVGRKNHPVVHVTLADARAYAAWAGGRLPTEVEWEYAATLGLFDPRDSESGAWAPDGEPRANVWTGDFPTTNTADDGYVGRAPVGCFAASRIGVYDMIGNVWEWTDSPFGVDRRRYTTKGGSYLCSRDHCRRFRAAARGPLEPDFSTAHTGFRIARDLPP